MDAASKVFHDDCYNFYLHAQNDPLPVAALVAKESQVLHSLKEGLISVTADQLRNNSTSSLPLALEGKYVTGQDGLMHFVCGSSVAELRMPAGTARDRSPMLAKSPYEGYHCGGVLRREWWKKHQSRVFGAVVVVLKWNCLLSDVSTDAGKIPAGQDARVLVEVAIASRVELAKQQLTLKAYPGKIGAMSSTLVNPSCGSSSLNTRVMVALIVDDVVSSSDPPPRPSAITPHSFLTWYSSMEELQSSIRSKCSIEKVIAVYRKGATGTYDVYSLSRLHRQMMEHCTKYHRDEINRIRKLKGDIPTVQPMLSARLRFKLGWHCMVLKDLKQLRHNFEKCYAVLFGYVNNEIATPQVDCRIAASVALWRTLHVQVRQAIIATGSGTLAVSALQEALHSNITTFLRHVMWLELPFKYGGLPMPPKQAPTVQEDEQLGEQYLLMWHIANMYNFMAELVTDANVVMEHFKIPEDLSIELPTTCDAAYFFEQCVTWLRALRDSLNAQYEVREKFGLVDPQAVVDPPEYLGKSGHSKGAPMRYFLHRVATREYVIKEVAPLLGMMLRKVSSSLSQTQFRRRIVNSCLEVEHLLFLGQTEHQAFQALLSIREQITSRKLAALTSIGQKVEELLIVACKSILCSGRSQPSLCREAATHLIRAELRLGELVARSPVNTFDALERIATHLRSPELTTCGMEALLGCIALADNSNSTSATSHETIELLQGELVDVVVAFSASTIEAQKDSVIFSIKIQSRCPLQISDVTPSLLLWSSIGSGSSARKSLIPLRFGNESSSPNIQITFAPSGAPENEDPNVRFFADCRNNTTPSENTSSTAEKGPIVFSLANPVWRGQCVIQQLREAGIVVCADVSFTLAISATASLRIVTRTFRIEEDAAAFQRVESGVKSQAASISSLHPPSHLNTKISKPSLRISRPLLRVTRASPKMELRCLTNAEAAELSLKDMGSHAIEGEDFTVHIKIKNCGDVMFTQVNSDTNEPKYEPGAILYFWNMPGTIEIVAQQGEEEYEELPPEHLRGISSGYSVCALRLPSIQCNEELYHPLVLRCLRAGKFALPMRLTYCRPATNCFQMMTLDSCINLHICHPVFVLFTVSDTTNWEASVPHTKQIQSKSEHCISSVNWPCDGLSGKFVECSELRVDQSQASPTTQLINSSFAADNSSFSAVKNDSAMYYSVQRAQVQLSQAFSGGLVLKVDNAFTVTCKFTNSMQFPLRLHSMFIAVDAEKEHIMRVIQSPSLGKELRGPYLLGVDEEFTLTAVMCYSGPPARSVCLGSAVLLLSRADDNDTQIDFQIPLPDATFAERPVIMTVDHPVSAHVGEPFYVTVKLRNLTSQPQKVDVALFAPLAGSGVATSHFSVVGRPKWAIMIPSGSERSTTLKLVALQSAGAVVPLPPIIGTSCNGEVSISRVDDPRMIHILPKGEES